MFHSNSAGRHERTNEQDAALRAVSAWLNAGDGQQVFRLFGYAGTGKTSLARVVAEGVTGDVIFCALTGKAAHVLRSNGCPEATTIHSLIYRPTAAVSDSPVAFVRNPASRASTAALIVVDEGSMIDAQLGQELLSYGTKVLVLGDPFQLPPVKGNAFFTQGKEPDVMLRDVQRQRVDSPVVRLSMIVRQGRLPELGAYGSSRVIRQADLSEADVLQSHQMLVDRHDARRIANRRIRSLMHRRSALPEPGEQLVCLRNYPDRGMMNGAKYIVTTVHPKRGRHDRPRGMSRGGLQPRSDQHHGEPAQLRGQRLWDEGRGRPIRLRIRTDCPQGAGLAVGVRRRQG